MNVAVPTPSEIEASAQSRVPSEVGIVDEQGSPQTCYPFDDIKENFPLKRPVERICGDRIDP